MIKSAKVSATYNVLETFCEREKENEPQGGWQEASIKILWRERLSASLANEGLAAEGYFNIRNYYESLLLCG